jgi:hypothetical protein
MFYQLRAAGMLPRAEELALYAMQQRNIKRLQAEPQQITDAAVAAADDVRRAADADVARHGLRACALPGCGATEPHPKLFKLCARCRRAAYCSAAHQREDWRRHKRAECSGAPGAA